MTRKFFAFILLGMTAVSAAYAQTPAPNARAGTRVFSMFNNDGGYLGVETAEVTKENFGKYGLREIRGVAVEKVVDGSPAQTAGLLNGDVIVKFNGEDVTSVRKLTRLLGEVAPDHQARITVLRSGDERELAATIGRRPTPRFEEGSFSMGVPARPSLPFPPSAEMPRIPSVPGAPLENFYFRSGSGRQIGIGITPLTKQLAEHYGVAGGVLVSNVRENSPAAKAGLKAGDLIVEVDGKELNGDGDLIRAISEKKEGDVSLTIVRDRSRQTIRVTPEEVKGGFNNTFEFPEGTAPEVFRMTVPKSLSPAVAPLNQFVFPGRVL